MALKMTAELNKIFETCKSDTLDPNTSELIALAVHLVTDHAQGATESARQAHKQGITAEQLHRVACLCACTAGARVEKYALPRDERYTGNGRVRSWSRPTPQKNAFHACSSKSLDKKTTHLVALAACLASG